MSAAHKLRLKEAKDIANIIIAKGWKDLDGNETARLYASLCYNRGGCPLVYEFCPFPDKMCSQVTAQDWVKHIENVNKKEEV